MRTLFLFVSIFLTTFSNGQDTLLQQPKIGLVLSGGGARGLAHISVLKAIEKANIKVDYIAGTSMGAIIGGLYAMGYSPETIEKIVLAQNWDELMSGQLELNNITIEEKNEYVRYITAFPIKNKQIRLPGSVLNDQNVSSKLAQLFAPANAITNFDSLPIPFHCIATDIEHGKAVVLKSGDLGESIRASMALPTIFSPIEINGKLLVDGGLIRNFPVDEVKAMGADIVIGSYTSVQLKTKEELNSALDILYQASNFNDINTSNELMKECDILFQPNVQSYGVGDFDDANAIIDSGMTEAITKRDLLEQYGQKTPTLYTNKILPIDSISIDSIIIEGLEHLSADFILSKLSKTQNSNKIDFNTLQKEINRVYGSRLFEYVHFKIVNKKDKTTLLISVKERPRAYVKVGLHYDYYNLSSVTLNLTLRNFILHRSRLLLTTQLSQKPKVHLSYLKYFGKKRSTSYVIGGNYNDYNLPIYKKAITQFQLDYQYLNLYFNLQVSPSQNWLTGIGTTQEYSSVNSKVEILNFIEKESYRNKQVYFFSELNSFDNFYYPNKGVHMDVKLGYYFDIKSAFNNDSLGVGSQSIELKDQTENFYKISLNWKSAHQINDVVTLISYFNTGYINSSSTKLFHGNFIGGVNQISESHTKFVGLNDMEIVSNSFGIIGFEPRLEPWKKIYFHFPVNVLLYNTSATIEVEEGIKNAEFIFGYGVGLGYMSFIGPIELQLHNNTSSDRLRADVNIGFYLY